MSQEHVEGQVSTTEQHAKKLPQIDPQQPIENLSQQVESTDPK